MGVRICNIRPDWSRQWYVYRGRPCTAELTRVSCDRFQDYRAISKYQEVQIRYEDGSTEWVRAAAFRRIAKYADPALQSETPPCQIP